MDMTPEIRRRYDAAHDAIREISRFRYSLGEEPSLEEQEYLDELEREFRVRFFDFMRAWASVVFDYYPAIEFVWLNFSVAGPDGRPALYFRYEPGILVGPRRAFVQRSEWLFTSDIFRGAIDRFMALQHVGGLRLGRDGARIMGHEDISRLLRP